MGKGQKKDCQTRYQSNQIANFRPGLFIFLVPSHLIFSLSPKVVEEDEKSDGGDGGEGEEEVVAQLGRVSLEEPGSGVVARRPFQDLESEVNYFTFLVQYACLTEGKNAIPIRFAKMRLKEWFVLKIGKYARITVSVAPDEDPEEVAASLCSNPVKYKKAKGLDNPCTLIKHTMRQHDDFMAALPQFRADLGMNP